MPLEWRRRPSGGELHTSKGLVPGEADRKRWIARSTASPSKATGLPQTTFRIVRTGEPQASWAAARTISRRATPGRSRRPATTWSRRKNSSPERRTLPATTSPASGRGSTVPPNGLRSASGTQYDSRANGYPGSRTLRTSRPPKRASVAGGSPRTNARAIPSAAATSRPLPGHDPETVPEERSSASLPSSSSAVLATTAARHAIQLRPRRRVNATSSGRWPRPRLPSQVRKSPIRRLRASSVLAEKTNGKGVPAGPPVRFTSGASPTTTCAFVPLNPKELTAARRGIPPSTSHGRVRVFTWNGLRARSSSSFSLSKWSEGTSVLRSRQSSTLSRPAIPEAARAWPMFVLTDPMAAKPVRAVFRRNAAERACTSIGSPSPVPVPWAST